MHRHQHAFRQRTDFDGQISELMKSPDLINFIGIYAKSSVHNPLVFANSLIEGLGKKLLVEIIDQIGLNEALKTEHDHTVPHVNAGHAGSIVGNRLRDAFGKHHVMTGFICIN